MVLSIEKAFGFFDAKERNCVRLKSWRISGRRADLWYRFSHQVAYWWL